MRLSLFSYLDCYDNFPYTDSSIYFIDRMMDGRKKVITIDGYVATGKGTTAQAVAHRLGYMYLDTGAMYRAVTLYSIEHGLLISSEEEKKQMMSQIELSFHYNPETDHNDIILN